MEGIVVIFDFDKTIIDCDSDNWVVDGLGFTELFNKLLPTMPWNTLMDTMMKEMHAKGVTIDQIKDVLRTIPIHPRVIPAIKAAHAARCDLRIVSDANEFFIETILKHLGLREYFSEINTNPGYVNEEGRLRILPYHDFNSSPHGCDRCPPNMCKALIIERLLSNEGGNKFIYLGDGIGDYCPSLKLREGDYAMPRKNFPVWDLISANPKLIRANIHEWTDGADLEHVLLSLIQAIITNKCGNDAGKYLSVDCKLETTMPLDSLPKALHGGRPQCSIFVPKWKSSFNILQKSRVSNSWARKMSSPIQARSLPVGLRMQAQLSHGLWKLSFK